MDRQSRHARSYRAVRSRPARRSTRKRRPVLKVIVHVLIACVVVCCVVLVIAKAIKPILLLRAESRQIAELEKQSEKVQAENRSLTEQKNYLQTARGKEQEARKLGWVKPGEVGVIVGQSVESPLLDGRPVETPKKPRESIFHRAIHLVVRHK
jgi:hypothetical protein